jgi:TatA/E family protein of Tat protein translocase
VFLFIFESVSATEMLIVLAVALIIFGPRKLPQLSRSVGRSLADFKRASHEFKQTWEREASLAELEEEEQPTGRAMLPEEGRTISSTVGRARPVTNQTAAPDDLSFADTSSPVPQPTITPVETDASWQHSEAAATDAPSEPTRKRDWL